MMSQVKKNDMEDIFGDSISSTPASGRNDKIAYNKNGLLITLNLSAGGENSVIEASFVNSGPRISDFLFQCAVPKTLKLTMLPPSSTTIEPNGKATQILQAHNPSNVR